MLFEWVEAEAEYVNGQGQSARLGAVETNTTKNGAHGAKENKKTRHSLAVTILHNNGRAVEHALQADPLPRGHNTDTKYLTDGETTSREVYAIDKIFKVRLVRKDFDRLD